MSLGELRFCTMCIPEMFVHSLKVGSSVACGLLLGTFATMTASNNFRGYNCLTE